MLYTLVNSCGSSLEVCNHGATITSIKVPDKQGNIGEVALGYADFGDYRLNDKYLGATVGRFANRIAGGRFSVGGREYAMPCNDNGINLLHSGEHGLSRQVFDVEVDEAANGLRLSYTSPAGEGGFPGTLDVCVAMQLTEDNIVRLDYSAATDADTPVNLTNHTYFNLRGSGTILDHTLSINAGRYTPVNSNLIPTGEIAPLEGTPLDFRSPAAIGARIDDDCAQLAICGGYDHNYVLDGEGFRPAAKLECDGRVLEVYTDMPGMQFYSGNFLEQPRRAACCFETQFYPDSPNQPGFPSCILQPGGVYKSRTEFRFSIRR